MLKIKLSIPGFGNHLRLGGFLGDDSNRHANYQFYVNDPSVSEVDYWFVIDDLQCDQEVVSIPPDRLFFLSAEVIYPSGYFDLPDKVAFLDQFSQIYTCHDIFRENVQHVPPFLSWMIFANHGDSIFAGRADSYQRLRDLCAIEKTRTLSVFCSTKTLTAEHRLRLKFVKKLKAHFGDHLDWFGNGANPLQQKWEGIAPYRYHVVLENQARHNVMTEKIFDSYLGLSYPIYWGAPNLSDYFSRDSFSPIEILDWRRAIDLIEKVVASDLWRERLPLMIESKQKILDEYNPFVRMTKIADGFGRSHLEPSLIKLSSVRGAAKLAGGSWWRQLQHRQKHFMYRLGRKLIEKASLE